MEWSPVHKANLILGTYLIAQVFYVLAIYGLPQIDALESYYDQDQIQLFGRLMQAMLLLSVCSLIVMNVCYLAWPRSDVYEHFAAQYFSLTHIFYGYSIGLLTMPVGVVLAGSPVVGMIFFHRRAVVFTFLSSISVLMVVGYLSAAGHIPYAPVVKKGDSVFWFFMYWALTLPQLSFMFMIAVFALKRWRMREAEVNRISRTDGLTGLMNRRCILGELDRLRKSCEMRRKPMCLLMVDLDYFKNINDRWGHDTGDRALVAAAQTLRESVRADDLVGRYGGEEFMVLLPGLDRKEAHVLAERLRKAIHEVAIDIPGEDCVTLSASIGMSCYTYSKELNVEALIKRADDALYQAKHAGRNQLVIAA